MVLTKKTHDHGQLNMQVRGGMVKLLVGRGAVTTDLPGVHEPPELP